MNDEPNLPRSSSHDVDLHLPGQPKAPDTGARLPTSPPYATAMMSQTVSKTEDDDLSNLMKSISLGDQIKDRAWVSTPRVIVSEYANLRSEAAFPPFDDLPEEYDINLEFYESTDGFSFRPRKHWCFLAEIIEVMTFLRLRLIVKDKTDRTVPIHFYTEDRGLELDPSYVREGYTVAILYAEQHGFLDFSVGIRHENPTVIKVKPLEPRSFRFSY